jgi:hypothetical protein
VLVYDQFAQMYGWTPRQVDELTLDEFQWLPVVRQARQDAAEQIAATKK